MPAYNFKSFLVPSILNGEKIQTIRKSRQRPTKAGDALYLYTGMRTKVCKKIMDAICISVESIVIDEKTDIYLGGRCLYESAKESFAWRDGFRPLGYCFSNMLEFFQKTYGLPFKGELIKWSPNKACKPDH